MKIVNTNEMKGIELKCLEYNISTDTLMENAGLATAEICNSIMLQSKATKPISILYLLIGKGFEVNGFNSSVNHAESILTSRNATHAAVIFVGFSLHDISPLSELHIHI